MGTSERVVVSALRALPHPPPLPPLPRTATSPLRATPREPPAEVGPSVGAAEQRTAASEAVDAFATPLSRAPQPPPLCEAHGGASAECADEAALEHARALCDRFSADVLRLEAKVKTQRDAMDGMPAAAVARELNTCDALAGWCREVVQGVDAASHSFFAAARSMAGGSVPTAFHLVSTLNQLRSAAQQNADNAATLAATARAYLKEHKPPRFCTTTVGTDPADGVLDNIGEKFMWLEWVAREESHASAQHPRRTGGAANAAERAAIKQMLRVRDAKITGQRRMLFLKRTAATADSPALWRGQSDDLEALLEGGLPLSDVEGNAKFTALVDEAVAAHLREYEPGTKPDEKMTVALMWTDPFKNILRQLAHIDAKHGQAISVLMLSRLGDAFVVQSGAPEISADQLLKMIGLQPEHVKHVKDNNDWKHVHSQAKEFGLLPLPQWCDSFMVDAVAPGEPQRTRCAYTRST